MNLRPDTFKYFCEALHQRTAIRLTDNKEYLVESRLGILAKQNGMRCVDDLVVRLRSPGSSSLWRDVVDAMTTNETSFFRDATPFAVLKEKVIPRLIGDGRKPRALNVWSAAAASGQEAYSVSILWNEIRGNYPGWKMRILATDISNKMLERGKEATYSNLEVVRGLSQERLDSNFQFQNNRWVVNPEIRENVSFKYLNLINGWPTLPQMDIVFMRNVLVYFDMETRKQLLARLRKVLKPDGFLFLGGAESALTIDEGFEKLFESGSSCYQLKAENDE
jgi:chemotaxis protein methyltransferase CheR